MKITYYSPPLSVTSHKWHSSYTASLWHSWIPCLYFCTISQYPRTAVYYHRLRSLACLPLYLYPFHYPETFPASSPSPLPLSKSDWWFKQQPSAVRYSCSVCVTCWHSKDCLRSRPFVPGFHLCICSRLCICVNRLLCEHILMTSACAYAPYKNAYRSCWDCDWNATISIWSAASSLKRPLTQAEILILLCLHQTLHDTLWKSALPQTVPCAVSWGASAN